MVIIMFDRFVIRHKYKAKFKVSQYHINILSIFVEDK